jgi:hypothetical protein
VDKAIEKAERSGNKKIVSELKATRGVIDDSIHLGNKILANPSRLGVATKGVSAPPSLGILSLEPKIIASIEKAANVVAQATPAEAIGIKLSKKMGAARFTTPQRAAIPGKLLTDKAYLEIGDDLTRMIQGGLKKSWPTEIQSTTTVLKGHGKMHGYQFKVGDVTTQEQLSGLYTKLLKNDQTMKNIWPTQGDFTSFFGKLIIKAYPSKPAGRGNALFSAGKNSITLFGKMALPTSPTTTKLPETVPNWILRRIESLDFNHEMVHYVDELTGILKAGRAQRRGMTPKVKYPVRVHEINARYQAAISEVRKRIIAGDTQMISLVVDNQGDDFARKFVNIMDAKANGEIYKGVSALPQAMRVEFMNHITGPGGAHKILRDALSKSRHFQGSRLAPSRPIPGGFTIPPEGPYIINPRNEAVIRKLVQHLITEVTELNADLYGSLEKAIADSEFWIEGNTEDDGDYEDVQGFGLMHQTGAAQYLQDTLQFVIDRIDDDTIVVVQSPELDANPGFLLTPDKPMYPDSMIAGGYATITPKGKKAVVLNLAMFDDSYDPNDINAQRVARKGAGILRHELVHLQQVAKRAESEGISLLDAFEAFKKEPKVIPPEGAGRQQYIKSHIEVDAHAHQAADELLSLYGKGEALRLISKTVDFEELGVDLPHAIEDYLMDNPSSKTAREFRKKTYEYIINLATQNTDDEVI